MTHERDERRNLITPERQATINRLEQIVLNRKLKYADEKPREQSEHLISLLKFWDSGIDFNNLNLIQRLPVSFYSALGGLEDHCKVDFYSKKMSQLLAKLRNPDPKPSRVNLLRHTITGPSGFPASAFSDIFSFNRVNLATAEINGVKIGNNDVLTDLQLEDISLVNFRTVIEEGRSRKRVTEQSMYNWLPTKLDDVDLEVVHKRGQFTKTGIMSAGTSISLLVNPPEL